MAIAEANRLAEVGEYYFSKKLKEINEMEKRGTNVINLGIGNPDLPPSESTISTLVSSAINPENHGYQSYRSSSDLRQAISEFYNKTYSVDLNPETEVLPLIGSKEGIMHISMAFLNPGDEVLVPNPGYPAYTSASKILGAVVKYYDLKEENNWQINIAELKNKDLSKVKIMWINYPHMPTGALPSGGMFKELVSLAKENNFLLCNDNPYSLILNKSPESLLSVDGAKEFSLELNSLSKSHNMAGWRLGWVAGNKNHIDSVLKVKSNIDSGIFLPIQQAAVEALKNSPAWYSERNEILCKRREAVFELLDSLNCTYEKNGAGLFVWAKLPESIVNAEEFIDELLNKANVFITPGFIFGSNGMRYVRVSLCSSRQKINEAIQIVKSKLRMKEKV